jgi:chemotaxis response regulator CheB
VLKQLGGYCLVQSRENCPVFGMPAAAIEAGWADQVMGPEEMSTFLAAL